jgi:hypothetical protein
MVDGGPADVNASEIGALSVVTVKLWASFEPGWTVPEKFSVTTAVVGAVSAAMVDAEVAGSEPVEHPVAASPAVRRAIRYSFTLLIRELFCGRKVAAA